MNTDPVVTNTFLGLFAQDDVRVSQKLSVQLGLRWDLMTPPVQIDNRQSNFSPVDGLIHLASDADRALVDTHYDYVAPRLGRMRVSPHVFNDETDADRFVAALGRRLRG